MGLTPSDLCEEMKAALVSQGWYVSQSFYSQDLCRGLAYELLEMANSSDRLKAAAVGAKAHKIIKKENTYDASKHRVEVG